MDRRSFLVGSSGKSLKDKQVLLRKTQDAETGKPLRTSRWSAPSSSNSSQKGVPAAGRFAPLLQGHPWMRICYMYERVR